MLRTLGWHLRNKKVVRRKHAQAMRTCNVRICGSRWNRPCLLEALCEGNVFCICNGHAIAQRRSRGCNRVACSFLKWCRSIPSRAEQPPPWRIQWAQPGKLTYLPRFLRGYRQPFGLR